MIAWSECFATHIEIVDNQHKRLFELLNKLSDSYNKNGPCENSVDEILKSLIAYADEHFIEEELLMLHSKLDERHISIHRMEHKSFIYDVNNMWTHLSSEEDLLSLTENLVCFITSWLTYHILGTDRVMVAQLLSIQHGASPKQAYELRNNFKYDAAVTRLMLDSVLDLWRISAERCYKLEKKLAHLRQ